MYIDSSILIEDPVIKALIESQVLTIEKHMGILYFSNSLYFIFAKNWLENQFKNMSYKERIHYFFWRRFNLEYRFRTNNRSSEGYFTEHNVKDEMAYEFWLYKTKD